MKITSLNALEEALTADISVKEVLISNTLKGKRITKIKKLCKDKNILFKFIPSQAIDRKAGGKKNQGVFAEISPIKFLTLPEILAESHSGMILILNRIMDPHNLGAIIRTAVATEVDGIILSKRNSAPVNDTVLKTSAGALLKSRIAISANLTRDIEYLKSRDFWIIGTEIKEGINYCNYDFNLRTALIMGSENKGLSPILRKKIDQFITIPHSSKVDSLNVSVATGIILFEAIRQKS